MNAGCPSQGSKQAQDEKMNGSETDSGEESEKEHEQSSGKYSSNGQSWPKCVLKSLQAV